MAHSSPLSQREYELRDDQNLLSRTDLKGRITYAAPGFIEASGYSLEELIGAPHSLVRHPDMPKEAFANLWETIQRGEIWSGLVKNRRKNGDFYWVRANVAPIIEDGQLLGYCSVRVKPSREERDHAERTYARIRAGDTGGISLRRGEITKPGLRGWLQRLNLNSLKVRLNGMVVLNLMLLCLTAGMSYFGYQQTTDYLQQLLASEHTAYADKLLHAMQGHQQTLLTIQLALMLAVGGTMVGVGSLVLASFLRQLNEAISFAMQIAMGNLAATPPNLPKGEIGKLLNMLIIMRKSLGNIVSDVYQCLRDVQPAAQSIASGNMDLSARTEQQASALQQTAASMEQITATVQQNAHNAQQASMLSGGAAKEVSATSAAMASVVSSMDSIRASSDRIAQITSVIDGIAFQTNILALNASVEAARAGEHGRGFAVVASEVRSLATRSAEAAKDITRLIDLSRKDVEAGAKNVANAERIIERVNSSVVRVNDLMGEIAAASDEQTRGIEQVTQAVAQMDEVTQRNADLVQNSAKDAADMDSQVTYLTNVISVLRTGGQGAEQVSREARFASHAARRKADDQPAPKRSPSHARAHHDAAFSDGFDAWH